MYRSSTECEQYEYPEEIKAAVWEIDGWINRHTKEVWDFCVDVLGTIKKQRNGQNNI